MDLDLHVVDMAREMIVAVLVVAGPIMMVGLCVGLTVSLIQALTSVQEQTLSLVPKMLAVMAMTLLVLAPALSYLGDYTARVFRRITEFGLS
jgi:flagellar biosynthetic protein FliQ